LTLFHFSTNLATLPERAGFVDQVKSLIRQNRRGLSKEGGFELER
jgi:hypothetical protein